MSEYNIQMNKYNALNAGYDQLYPQPMKHANTHAEDGNDPITPSMIGTYNKTEIDTALQNKAPAGFGYGETQSIIFWNDEDGTKLEQALEANFASASTRNKVFRTSFVDFPICKVSGNGGFADIYADTSNDSNGYATSILIVYYARSGNVHGPAMATKQKLNGTWYPWEYVNPPMIIGEEYRTTERYLGKPVYVKSFEFNSWTADAVTSLNVAATWIVDDTMTWRMGTMKNGVDHPSGIKYWVIPNGEIFDSSIGNNMAVKMFGTDNWGGSKILTVKYTKD